MSIELNRSSSEYRQLLIKPLLQSGELPIAKVIPDPEKIDMNDLVGLWRMAKDYVESTPFSALALTQLNPEMMKKMNVRNDLLRIIYFRNSRSLDGRLRDCLFVNSKVLKTSSQRRVEGEGCGSIAKNRVGQVVARASDVEVEGYLFNPQITPIPSRKTIYLSGPSAFLYLHEEKHLDGLDSSYLEEDLLDFSDPSYPGWIGVEIRREEIWEAMHGIHSQYIKWREWLIRRDNKLIIVDMDGNYLRDFKRASSLRI